MGAATAPPIPVCMRRRLIYEMLLLVRPRNNGRGMMTLCRRAVSASGAGVAEQASNSSSSARKSDVHAMAWPQAVHVWAGARVFVQTLPRDRARSQEPAQEPPTKRGGILVDREPGCGLLLPCPSTLPLTPETWCGVGGSQAVVVDQHGARSPWSPSRHGRGRGRAWAWDRSPGIWKLVALVLLVHPDPTRSSAPRSRPGSKPQGACISNICHTRACGPLPPARRPHPGWGPGSTSLGFLRPRTETAKTAKKGSQKASKQQHAGPPPAPCRRCVLRTAIPSQRAQKPTARHRASRASIGWARRACPANAR